jgi:hypothetical protein
MAAVGLWWRAGVRRSEGPANAGRSRIDDAPDWARRPCRQRQPRPVAFAERRRSLPRLPRMAETGERSENRRRDALDRKRSRRWKLRPWTLTFAVRRGPPPRVSRLAETGRYQKDRRRRRAGLGARAVRQPRNWLTSQIGCTVPVWVV